MLDPLIARCSRDVCVMCQITAPDRCAPSTQVIDLASLESSEFLNPLGQSGNEFSSLYDNLLSAWSDGNYIPMATATGKKAKTATFKP